MEKLESDILNEDDQLFGKLDHREGKSSSLKFDESLLCDDEHRKSLVVNGRKIALGECTFIF